MRAGLILLLVGCWVCVALADDPPAQQTDSEVWNLGVDYYRAGDVTNALRVLRPLMLSRTHGARAAEVVAKLAYEKGNLEAAADAAQIALRANPADAKANRNFTRATDRLPQERERQHIEKVLKESQGKDPGALLQQATHEARTLMRECSGIATNSPARAVALSARFSKRAKDLTDVWIPVREVIAQSVTNAEQAATIIAQIEEAQAKTKTAAIGLEDMDENAYSALAYAEQDLTRFLKMAILPPAAMDEGEQAQTNAWRKTEPFNERNWQKEAFEYTQAFREKFPAWTRAYEQQAQSDTNMPPFTAEDQAKVSALATELAKVQLACLEKDLPQEQQKALALISQIRALLPKDKKGGGGQSQQNPNPNQQQNNPEDKNQQKQDQPQQQNQDQQQQLEQQQEQQEEEKESEAQESEEKPEDKEIEAVLKKAQERSDEHEAEKKARMRKAPLPPNARDW